jgi:hypothetical protein
MSRFSVILLLILPLGLPLVVRADGPQVAHMVFFTVKGHAPEARERLVAACQKYLAGHEGTVYFSAGSRATDLVRDVNDQDFDVALHVVFRDRAAHDRYQTNERHLKFIEENSELWTKVRVFDSYLAAGQESAPDAPPEAREGRRLPLPDAASAFAGLVRGTVVRLRDRGLELQIEQVVREWEHSKAKNAASLVGKRIVVDSVPHEAVVSFLRSLKVGDQVTLDVAHREGERLTVLELTDEQRQQPRQ